MVYQVDYELRRQTVVSRFCSYVNLGFYHVTINPNIVKKAELRHWLSKNEVPVVMLGRESEAVLMALFIGSSWQGGHVALCRCGEYVRSESVGGRKFPPNSRGGRGVLLEVACSRPHMDIRRRKPWWWY